MRGLPPNLLGRCCPRGSTPPRAGPHPPYALDDAGQDESAAGVSIRSRCLRLGVPAPLTGPLGCVYPHDLRLAP